MKKFKYIRFALALMLLMSGLVLLGSCGNAEPAKPSAKEHKQAESISPDASNDPVSEEEEMAKKWKPEWYGLISLEVDPKEYKKGEAFGQLTFYNDAPEAMSPDEEYAIAKQEDGHWVNVVITTVNSHDVPLVFKVVKPHDNMADYFLINGYTDVPELDVGHYRLTYKLSVPDIYLFCEFDIVE